MKKKQEHGKIINFQNYFKVKKTEVILLIHWFYLIKKKTQFWIIFLDKNFNKFDENLELIFSILKNNDIKDNNYLKKLNAPFQII